MSLPEITQNNVHLFIPYKVACLASCLVEEEGYCPKSALLKIYSSDFYKELEQEKTKLWWEGPQQLYRIWRGEIE